MRNRHGMVLVHPADGTTVAASDNVLTQFSRGMARIKRRIENVSAASHAEPASWTREQYEDVIATLDRVADMAAREADRLRDYSDRVS